MSYKQQFVLSICNGLTIFPVVLLNFTLSFALYKLGDRRNKSKFFIFVLLISDTMFGLVAVPVHVVLSTALGSERSCWFERAFLFAAQSNGHFSFYTIMVISLESYLHVGSALRYGVQSQRWKRDITKHTELQNSYR